MINTLDIVRPLWSGPSISILKNNRYSDGLKVLYTIATLFFLLVVQTFCEMRFKKPACARQINKVLEICSRSGSICLKSTRDLSLRSNYCTGVQLDCICVWYFLIWMGRMRNNGFHYTSRHVTIINLNRKRNVSVSKHDCNVHIAISSLPFTSSHLDLFPIC